MGETSSIDEVTDLRVVSATRHEGDNVGPLTKRLADILMDVDISWELVFVDDSDDDTPERICELVEAFPVRMFHRVGSDRAGGLSSALNVGFVTAESPMIVVIDADLQHPPEIVPDLLAPLLAGEADLVIGSRYVPGGSASGLDGPFRPIVSRAATRLVQAIFPSVRRVQDPVSGFFAFNADVIRSVDLRAEGYKMLVEILVRGNAQRVVEVPFQFAGRNAGASNVSTKQAMHFLRHMALLWKETNAPRWIRRQGPSNPAYEMGVMETETGEYLRPDIVS